MALPVYSGTFGVKEATRLLWRAGFGPRPGEATSVQALGLNAAVDALFNPKKPKLKGKAPKDGNGRPIKPSDRYGHDHLWFLDRMIRTDHPLQERMTLIWHDWFATSNDGVNSQSLMLGQNETFRKNALGSFFNLVQAVTIDPAMLLWLSGANSTKDNPNENYGRELMELFTLGADRPNGYTEQDVRNQARALTGWTYSWSNKGPTKFHFEPSYHDTDPKTVFGQTGNWTFTDSPRLCLEHPNHPSFFVLKLWSYFIPTPPSASDQSDLEALYLNGQYGIGPVVKAILKHPTFYTGPSMVKPPVVFTAGILRALNRYIDTMDWVWLDAQAGQQLFYPPNVAGWDDNRWLDTASYQARWYIAYTGLHPTSANPWGKLYGTFPTTAQALLDKALLSLGSPALEDGAKTILLQFAQDSLDDATDEDKQKTYPIMIYNGLRQLLLTLPEAHTC